MNIVINFAHVVTLSNGFTQPSNIQEPFRLMSVRFFFYSVQWKISDDLQSDETSSTIILGVSKKIITVILTTVYI